MLIKIGDVFTIALIRTIGKGKTYTKSEYFVKLYGFEASKEVSELYSLCGTQSYSAQD